MTPAQAHKQQVLAEKAAKTAKTSMSPNPTADCWQALTPIAPSYTKLNPYPTKSKPKKEW